MTDIRKTLGLRPVINCSGTMTSLGASIVVPHAVETVTAILSQWTEISDLQRIASRTIERLTGAEAGCVTASCSAAVTLACAAAMTGKDLAAIERLPDTTGLKDEIVIQTGHMVSYGAPVEQGIRLSGAKVVPVGQATSAHAYQLAGAITDKTAAAVYVISHHVVDYGQIALETFCEVAHEKGVPVIVDAASEYDLEKFLKTGADLVLYSGHKFLGGPTSGIIAGEKNFVAACYLQNRGVGRGMKVGKEGVAGVIAALEAWETRDHAGIRAREQRALDLWQSTLEGRDGITAIIDPDPTDNPLDRLKVLVDPEGANISAWDLADRMAQGERPVIVRDHEVEHNYFYLDPCNLHPDEEFVVAERLTEELDAARKSNTPIVSDLRLRVLAQEKAILNWPD
ncbi:aminotransferase class V-fold PLP-dependent enzyme [Pelagibacterium halotolerans]|uniref:L-seryl-tRNA(Sec) selenium transferase-related protein n=1 Tax=Pelagibacterium halotolerans (strain DSM 22347 / JCM 15775 / CGMCC 1.7692 / B2) TaxID=1082931 RepID=G4RCD2_PELHB|nr:aminotransferase class V-fold PLP-dependent enzyme [Pelagibacterium halotolerans]AEQ53726.1 L-seryl-tRNA(Sec) selenium transferase-related protein [Pelagibacterium halotolerans B2]QJR20111.1 aminotransferase class V-fold PLP-dependent enzyme [Pelagibacterium halotolerans]SEA79667.1 L-seryl-tRNA(Sec) selenium transferase [Pelagibacterium halotolerans]